MKGLLKTISSFFGYTRNERRSSSILIILIFIVIIIRFIIPDNIVQMDIKNIIADTLYYNESKLDEIEVESTSKAFNAQVTQNGKLNYIPELNSCDSADLEALPGLGPVLSGRIIKFRNLLGGFYSIEQLREVYGLNEDIFEIVKSKIKVDTALIKKINVNKATYYDLVRLPYLNSDEVNSLLSYRKIVDNIESMDELFDNRIISEEKGYIISHYLDFK